MNTTVVDEDAEKPLDPAMERVRRKMVRLLVIALGIMMIGLMAVLYAIVHKMSGSGTEVAAVSAAIPAGADEISASITLPKGAQINGESLSGSRILFDLTLPDGKRELAVYDTAERRFVARFFLTNAE
jgi:hypothetical protein